MKFEEVINITRPTSINTIYRLCCNWSNHLHNISRRRNLINKHSLHSVNSRSRSKGSFVILSEEVAANSHRSRRSSTCAVDFVAVIRFVERYTSVEWNTEIAGLRGWSSVFQSNTKELWGCSCGLFMSTVIIRYQITITKPGTLTIFHGLEVLGTLSICTF